MHAFTKILFHSHMMPFVGSYVKICEMIVGEMVKYLEFNTENKNKRSFFFVWFDSQLGTTYADFYRLRLEIQLSRVRFSFGAGGCRVSDPGVFVHVFLGIPDKNSKIFSKSRVLFPGQVTLCP